MIKKLIKRLLNKTEINQAKIITKHNIDKQYISENALTVVRTLQQAGYSAFIVGGAVRDLLLGIKPKDFDISTNATPQQICKLFKKARIIGKRFQIVLLPFYRGRNQELIEITTFRAKPKHEDVVLINDNTLRPHASENKIAIDSSGQVWSDNVWGTHAEDASRRDFTMNALYLEPDTQQIYDFYNGIDDVYSKTIRIIGEANTRYKEDPVRMLRIARFLAKTNFNIEASTLEPIKKLAQLLNNIPPARLSDELLKMLVGGYAQKSIKSINTLHIAQYILPWHNVKNTDSQSFIDLVLQRTDERLAENKSVSAGFIFAAIYWPLVVENWLPLQDKNPYIESLCMAMQKVVEPLQLQRRTISDMQEIWLLQPRLEKRHKSQIYKILQHERFRAGYDFLVLRAIVDKSLQPLADWWTKIQEADISTQELMIKEIEQIKKSNNQRRKNKSKNANKNKGKANSATALKTNKTVTGDDIATAKIDKDKNKVEQPAEKPQQAKTANLNNAKRRIYRRNKPKSKAVKEE